MSKLRGVIMTIASALVGTILVTGSLLFLYGVYKIWTVLPITSPAVVGVAVIGSAFLILAAGVLVLPLVDITEKRFGHE